MRFILISAAITASSSLAFAAAPPSKPLPLCVNNSSGAITAKAKCKGKEYPLTLNNLNSKVFELCRIAFS